MQPPVRSVAFSSYQAFPGTAAGLFQQMYRLAIPMLTPEFHPDAFRQSGQSTVAWYRALRAVSSPPLYASRCDWGVLPLAEYTGSPLDSDPGNLPRRPCEKSAARSAEMSDHTIRIFSRFLVRCC